MKILIDNGHGSNTAGKCSPDKKFREYAYTREIAQMLVDKLNANGYDAQRITPEDKDISLAERCRRINAICSKVGAKNCLSISIHNNAAKGDGKWHDARGFGAYISPNASDNSKKFARILVETAKKMNLMGNRSIGKDLYKVQNLAMCRDTKCPAVLTENLFQDNKEDVAFLISDEGKKAIVDLHYKAIVIYIKEIGT